MCAGGAPRLTIHRAYELGALAARKLDVDGSSQTARRTGGQFFAPRGCVDRAIELDGTAPRASIDRHPAMLPVFGSVYVDWHSRTCAATNQPQPNGPNPKDQGRAWLGNLATRPGATGIRT
jgi:hypothetical protein